MADRNSITPEILRQLLRYEPETGELFWLPRDMRWFAKEKECRRWNARYADKPAFTATNGNGYRSSRVLSTNVISHRAIWAIIHGEWPRHQIDHINGNRADNRLANLRAVTKFENGRNCRLSKRNTSGHTGVYPSRFGNWTALIGVRRKIITIGTYKTKEAAIAARKQAEAEFGFHENHGTPPN